MDIAVKRKPKIKLGRMLVITLVSLATLFAVYYLWFLSKASFSIARETIVLSEVQRDKFKVTVRGTGLLVPDNIQWLSSTVEGKVERVVVKSGNIVKKGDLIVQLSNPQLMQQLAEAEWELEALEAESNAATVAQESDLLEQKSKVLEAKMNFESSSLRNKAQIKLLSTGAVSKLDYERTILETAQFKQRWKISQEQYEKMKENLLAQNNARVARVKKTQKILERTQQQVSDLNVFASIDSVVLDMPLEPGQRITMGANVAKLAQRNSLIAELQVPEIQIKDVAVGQRVIVDTRNNKISGTVSRIEPAVIRGNVQVDVVFEGKLPDDARPDLSVDGEIIITEIADTLFVDRPLFAQSNSLSMFYKVSKDGQFADRVEVSVGFGSVNKVQVLAGLSVGDKIVTSDPSRFESHNRIRIK